MVFILKNLALGSMADAEFTAREISAFLNVAEEVDFTPPAGALYYKVPIKDFCPIPAEQLKEAVDWIKEHIRAHKVLVFCKAGIGRSSSVAIAYLCREKGMGFGRAVEFVGRKKPDISILPNLILSVDAIIQRKTRYRLLPGVW